MSTPEAGMRARTYRGSSVEELIPRIQQELGPDAIILRRREGLTGGILGFFQRSFVEIEATTGSPRIDVYDEDREATVPEGFPVLESPGARTEHRSELTPTRSPEPTPPPVYPRPTARPLTAHGAYVTEQLAALATASPGEPVPIQEPPPRQPAPTAPVFYEPPPHRPVPRKPAPRAPDVHELPSEHVLDSFAATLAAAESEPVPAAVARDRWSVPPASRGRKRAGVNVEKRLLRFGVSEGFARELIEVASAHVLPLAPGGGLTGSVRVALAQRIPVAPSLPTAGAAIVVVGAGGSGKTSYCAALMRAYRKSGALKTSYATLTWDAEGAGLQMLLSPHVMRPTPIGAPRSIRALRRARGEGMIVLDTPRLSPADKAGVRELSQLLAQLAPERVVVALPATLGATAAAQLLQALSPLGANSLVITHADETDQIGVAVEAACVFGLAPEYLLDRNRSGSWRVGRLDPATLAERLLS